MEEKLSNAIKTIGNLGRRNPGKAKLSLTSDNQGEASVQDLSGMDDLSADNTKDHIEAKQPTLGGEQSISSGVINANEQTKGLPNDPEQAPADMQSMPQHLNLQPKPPKQTINPKEKSNSDSQNAETNTSNDLSSAIQSHRDDVNNPNKQLALTSKTTTTSDDNNKKSKSDGKSKKAGKKSDQPVM